MGTSRTALWRLRDVSLEARRVLVVDDNPTVGAVIAEGLATMGHHVTHCTSADEALRHCREGAPEAILTEVGLACEDGQSLAAKLSEQHPDVPVAALTSWLDHPETRYIDRHGLRMVLHKPIRLERLDLALRALLDGLRTS